MTRWSMLADLERCVGCQTCTAACRHANATSPAVQWRKVLDVEAGTFPNVSRTFVPVGCQHCADPPCMHVCPTTATRQRPDGIVTIDYELCIGCAYCDVACPYQARFLIHEPRRAYGATAMQNEIMREDPSRLGVAQKCTFCSDRIDFGIENGIVPGTDPRATPACVNACIADALVFGDLDDPGSNVSRLLKEQRHFRMHEEIGTEPSFYYLYGKVGGEDAPAASAPAAPPPGAIRTRGVEPWHQQHWDWKAAGNFLCGGAGSGLFAATAIAGLAGAPMIIPGLASLGLVALGLFLLIFKIGRPLRAIYVLRQPRRSWMAREAWVAAAFFPLALAALWSDSGVLLGLAAVFALAFLLCQAMILKAAKGIPTWRAAFILPLIVTTGLAEGCGLFLCGTALLPELSIHARAAAAAVVVLVGARALLWSAYRAGLRRTGAPTAALQVLDRLHGLFLAVGLACPVVAIAIGAIAPPATALLFLLAGLSTFASGWTFKLILVTRAGFNQGFALTHTPVRGAGMAGPAVNPGWSLPGSAQPS